MSRPEPPYRVGDVVTLGDKFLHFDCEFRSDWKEMEVIAVDWWPDSCLNGDWVLTLRGQTHQLASSFAKPVRVEGPW